MDAFEQLGNPFLEDSGELLDLNRSIFMSPDVVDNVRKVKDIGLQLYTTFFNKRVSTQEDAFTATLHKTNLKLFKVSKGVKIRNRYNQVPHLTQDTNGKVTNSQLDTTNESQEVSPFPAGDHKAHINRRAQRHSKHKTEQKHKRSTKEVPPWNGQ